ncbi:MAG: hypothetical protein KAU28_10040, partial [Phycisphaerae bacterium]|nr:hypothetical protein [Phycisphaerae bacterium]
MSRQRSAKFSRRPQPKRRWWQILLRTVVLGALIVAGAYVTLPWWLPKGCLRDYIAERMQQQMGVAVSIDELTVSWSQGVEIRGLKIDSPPAFGDEPMAFVDTLRTEFSPVNLLFRDRLRWMRMDRPKLFVRVDEAGNVNIRPLQRLRFDVEPDRISIREGVATLKLPGHDRLLRLNVGDLQIVGGKLKGADRITMSAALDQAGGAAPIGLRLTAEKGLSRHAGLAASAKFNFSNIDLEKLGLQNLLKLPLRKLSGLCGGSLDLQLTSEGNVEQFDFNVSIRRLDVQPISGPKLPVIDEAGLSIAASLDPIYAGSIHLHSVNVLLPGIRLEGNASMSADALWGSWEAIDSLEMTGQIDPMRLAAVLTDRPTLPGELAVDGPVDVRLTFRHDGQLLRMELAADGTAVEVRRFDRAIKPAGRKLAMKLLGELDEKTWTFKAEQSELTLGGNRLSGQGTVQNVRKIVNRWAAADRKTIRHILHELTNLQWKGSWRVRELDSLCDLHPPLAAAMKDVRLSGTIEGNWTVDRLPAAQFHAACSMPAHAELNIGDIIVKPKGETSTLAITGNIDDSRSGLVDIMMDLQVAGGTLRILDGELLLIEDDTSDKAGTKVDFTGQFDASHMERLSTCLRADLPLRQMLRGAINGDFAFSLAEGVRQSRVAADLRRLEVAGNEFFVKRSGEAAALEINLTSRRASPQAYVNRIDILAKSAQADVAAQVDVPHVEGGKLGPVNIQARAKIADARWLLEHCPVLRRRLRGGRLSGKVELAVSARRDSESLASEFLCMLDSLEFVSSDKPLRISMAGAVKGQVDLATLTSGEQKRLAIKSHLDASELSIEEFTPPALLQADAELCQKFRVAKPLGVTAEADLELTAPADLSRLKVNNLTVRLGDLKLLADGELALKTGGAATIRAAHLALSAERLDNLEKLIPALKGHGLTGRAMIEAKWKNKNGPEIPYLTVHLDELRGIVDGEEFALSGETVLENIRFTDGRPSELSRLRTDGLKVWAGDNRLWLVADIENIPAGISGRIDILAEYVDDRSLGQWFARLG